MVKSSTVRGTVRFRPLSKDCLSRSRSKKGRASTSSAPTGFKTMTINPSGWRPAAPSEAGGEGVATFTGNRALMLEEALIFETGDEHTTGVDFEFPSRLREELREGLSSSPENIPLPPPPPPAPGGEAGRTP